MSSFESRFERLELKYLVDEATAARVCDDIAPFCRPDSHNPPPGSAGPRGYQVSSLYLDSPGLAFYHAKERGDPERVKLRIRTYADSPIAVVEVKRRVADVIDKTRAIIPRGDAALAATGRATAESNAEVNRFLGDFGALVACSGAEPKLHLRYEREAYASVVDHYARVTFDREIKAMRTDSWSLEPSDHDWTNFRSDWASGPADDSVVLELKCQSMIPWWVTELIQQHQLSRLSLSKYSLGIHVTGLKLGEDRTAPRSAKWMQ